MMPIPMQASRERRQGMEFEIQIRENHKESQWPTDTGPMIATWNGR